MKLQKKWLFLFSLVLVLIGLAGYGYLQSGSAPQAPTLVVEPPSFDFGTVEAKVETTFVMYNTGDAPLQLLGISTSCGCTSARADQQLIMPGARTRLYVSFDPNAHEGIEGSVVRQVYVRTNDPAQPETTLEIRASVVAPQGTP